MKCRVKFCLVMMMFLLGAATLQSAQADAPTTILRAAQTDAESGTIWRYYETWQSDVITVDGKPQTVDIFDPRVKAKDATADKRGFAVKQAAKSVGSPFPADDWRSVDFLDSGWVRHPGPFPNFYRSLALICLRGKFQVIDPVGAGELSLSIKFQGGAVAYMNGQEVGRAGLPAGKIDPDTLADAYPHEAFVDVNDDPIVTGTLGTRIISSAEPIRISYTYKTQDMIDRFRKRSRSLDVKIPATSLKIGLNVLAIEIHRAPADPIMFTALDLSGGNSKDMPKCWNRDSVEEISLTAQGDAAAVVPNVARPQGMQVWQEGILSKITPQRYGDPNEAGRAINIYSLKNGVFAGQVVVGSTKSIKNLNVATSDLVSGSNKIPASAISIAYPGIYFPSARSAAGRGYDFASGGRTSTFDAMETIPPALLSPVASESRNKSGAQPSVMQPIWITVSIPKDVPAGDYAGTITISAADEKPITVPVALKVIGDWVLPDPQHFTEFIGVHESANSVAMEYNVPLWSEEHWKDLDKVYELLGEIGTKDIYLPLVAKTHLANDQSMVRWIKQPDGTYKHDFTIVERYFDTAQKHLGNVPVVGLYLHDYGFRIEQSRGSKEPIVPVVTEFDPATGKLTDLKTPAWGTPEARAFWKPVIDGVIDIVKKRGMEKSLMFAIGANNWAQPECVADLKSMYPDIPWVNRTHYGSPTVGDGTSRQKSGLTSVVGGVISIFNDPDVSPVYGWKSTGPIVINFPRMGNVPGVVFGSYLSNYRIFAESALLSGGARWRSVQSVQGIGHIGADFWPVMKDAKGDLQNMGDRYVFWHSLSISDVMNAIISPGVNGPVASTRLEMMRQSLQESEVRIFVQNALLDPASKAKLGDELANRCKDLCDQRTMIIRYYSHFSEPLVLDDYSRVFDQQRWDDLSEKLYQAASDVSKALGKN